MQVIRLLLIALTFMSFTSSPANAACPDGQEHWTDGGCYRKCPDGSPRTGPASCKIPTLVTNCTDYGLSGSAATGTSCPAGQDYYGLTCYKGCPSGSTRTAVCTCDNVLVNTTSELLYGRAGPPLPCTPSANISTSRPLDITFYVTSDTHFHASDTFNWETHQGHVQVLNRMKDVKWPLWQGFVGSLSGRIGAPVGVIINGDYTHYGHDKELGIFREFYERGRKRSDLPIWIQGDPDVVQYFWPITTPIDYPTWVGFGNHELMGSGGPDRNRSYIASKMAPGCGDVVNMDSSTSAYSWNWGRLHLIQVNALGDDRPSTGFNSVMTWLQSDLYQFAKDGRPVIVFSHYALRGPESAKNLNGTYLSTFKAAFSGYNVIAMFAGHDHEPDLDDTGNFPVFRNSTGGQITYKVPSGAHVVHVTDEALDVAYYEWCPTGTPTTCAKNQSCPSARCATPASPYTGMYYEPTYNAAYSMHKSINGTVSAAESIVDDQAIDISSYAPATGGECDEPPLACPAGSNLYGSWVGGFCCYGETDGNTCSTGNMCALDPTRPQHQPLCCPTGMNLYGSWAGGFCCAGAVSANGQSCTTGEVCALDSNRTQGNKLCTSLRCPVGMTFYGASKGGFCCNGTVSQEMCSTSDVCALDANRTQGNRVCRSQCVARGPGCNTSIASGQCGFPASNAVEMCRAHPQCTALCCNKSLGYCFARDQTHMGSWSGMASIIVQKDIPAGPFQDEAINCGPSGCIASGPGCDTSAVSGQCSFPKSQAVALCSKHPKCVAVICNQRRGDCQARDTLERSPWRGMNSTLLTNPLVDQAINCGPNGCISSGPGCDTSAVSGQCSFPKGSALERCRKHSQCKAVICNSLRTDCQARDGTEHVSWSGFTSYIIDKN